jgi:hypothetical protein
VVPLGSDRSHILIPSMALWCIYSTLVTVISQQWAGLAVELLKYKDLNFE